MPTQFNVRDMRQKEIFRVNDVFVDVYAEIVGLAASMAYVTLCRHANVGQESWPSMDRIAERLGVSKSTVIRSIRKLEDHGLVGVVRGKSVNGRQAVNVYVLLDRSVWSKNPRRVSPQYPAPGVKPDVHRVSSPGVTTVPEGYTRKETQMKGGKNSVHNSSGPAPIRAQLDAIRRDLEARGILRPADPNPKQ